MAKKSKGFVVNPTKYRPEYCERFKEYFSVAPFYEKNGELKANPFPTLAGFACQIGVHRDTLHSWTKDHPEFAQVYKMRADYQENYLVQNLSLGLVPQPFGIFALKNVAGWRDQKPQDASPQDEEEIYRTWEKNRSER